jgi:hypothetical protein
MKAIAGFLLCAALSAAASAPAQESAPPLTNAELAAKIDALAKAMEQTREELNSARAEIQMLRQELAEREAASGNNAAEALRQSVEKIQEEQQVLASQVAQHDQTKVETASKYPLRVTGLLLFNTNLVNGAVDNDYDPTVALATTANNVHGGLQFTFRQSIIGVDAHGPIAWGAQTSADVNVDFFGGMTGTTYGAAPSSDSFLRLRTARLAAAWQNSIAEALYDRPIFSPNVPQSFASVGVSALGWSGNLWQWQPQLAGSHDFSFRDAQKLKLTAAFLDVPDPPYGSAAAVSAAERSRYPGSAAHVSYARAERLTLGAGGYWSPHNYGYGNTVDAWAVTGDWSAQLPAHLAVSGQVYRGAALGGLGGGAYKDVVQVYANGFTTYVQALHANGGWAQLHFSPTERLQANGAFGMDDADANQVRIAVYDPASPYALLARNQSWFGNVTYRGYASLLLSAEYRQIHTWQITGQAAGARVYSLSTGYQF